MNEYFYSFLLENVPYLMVDNGIVSQVGELLLAQLGYEKDDIVGLSELEVLDTLFGVRNKIQPEKKKFLHLISSKSGEMFFYSIQVCDHISSRQRLYIFKKRDSIQYDLNIIHQLISNSPFGMAVFSVPDITLLNANQSWLKRLDEPYNTREASIGRHISEIITGWKGSVLESIWNTVLVSGKSCYLPEYRYIGLKKGLSYWNISLTPIYEDSILAYFVEITHDVTETVMNRDKIRFQRDQLFKQFQQFETVVENMSDALFVLYPDSAAISLNQEAHFIKHLFNGFNKMEKIRDDIKYYDENDKEIPYNSLPAFRILQGEHYKAFRVTVKARDNTHHFSISGRPVFDNKKNIFFSIVCIRDVTSQVNHDNYMLKIEKEKKEYLERVIRLKDDFLTLISHEFKTPLTVIGTAIQAMELLCGNELSIKAKRYIDTIRQNSLRQLRLVSNLLDITRGTADQIRLHKRSVDIVLLTRLITDSVKIYAAQKNLQITFLSDFDKKLIFIDDEKYERIVLNLLSNAIKFTPKGKSIQVRLYKEKDYINLEVKDEGVGIPKEKIGLIFERFGQVDNSLSRQAEGTGMGLYLVKMFVEQMGGSISASSTLYKGATFLVKLPDEPIGQHDMTSELETVDNKKIIHMMNIEFSDIYLSK